MLRIFYKALVCRTARSCNSRFRLLSWDFKKQGNGIAIALGNKALGVRHKEFVLK